MTDQTLADQPSFAGQVVVVTGAAAGVGRAVSLRFARQGAKLGLISRDAAALEALAEEVRALGGQAAVAAIDVSLAADVATAADRFTDELGPIDIWVNDAMLTVFSLVRDISADEFKRVTEVTYLGVVYGTMAALRHMRGRDSGRIINIGSALAYRGIPLQAAYCGAKHAIRGFTGSVRSELDSESSQITISIIELPAMNTPQFDWARTHRPHLPRPMGTIYQPETAAEAVFQAAITGAPEYWVGASTVLTIVGNMIAPRLMDWWLGRTAIRGQETRAATPSGRRDNLFDPITEMHRTQGSFEGAHETAAILPGDATRAAIVAGGAALFFLIGFRAAGRSGRRARAALRRAGPQAP